MGSLVKLGCIVYVLMTDTEPCSQTLFFYLLLYGTCEAYEFLFTVIVMLQKCCTMRSITRSMMQTGQVSYEW